MRDGERGSISVLVAAVVAATVVLALGAADVTRVLAVAANAQTAADAAALAAAQELAIPSGDDPEDLARSYAGANGAALASCACSGESSDAVVEVRAEVGPLLLFADDRIVVARARAVVDVPGVPGG